MEIAGSDPSQLIGGESATTVARKVERKGGIEDEQGVLAEIGSGARCGFATVVGLGSDDDHATDSSCLQPIVKIGLA